MDRHVRAIVSHRLPNAEELKAGCGDWLECCQAYIHRDSCVTTKPLEPCPKCLDSKALTKWKDAEVSCGRCGFNAPFDVWQSRACISPASAAPVVDRNSVAFTAYNQAIEDAKTAIRREPTTEHGDDDGGYFAASFINAIARKCSPHVYVNRLAAAATATPVEQSGDAKEPARDREWIRKAANELYNSGCGHVMDVSEIETIIGHCWADSAPQAKT